jgi:hypothetical protein
MTSVTRSDFRSYQTDALFLLVGQNPLPNYVAAKLLLKENGTLYLVHSEGPQGSGKVAQRLATHLRQHQPQLIPVDPLDTADIHKKVEPYLTRASSGSVGLNYTGGTKVMAVHVYQAVHEFCRRRDLEAVFSYLDADTLSMSIEPRRGQYAFQRRVVHSIELTIKEVFDLHGIRLPGRLKTEPLLPNLARALAHQHSTSDGIKAWQDSREILQKSDGRPWEEVKGDILRVGTKPDVAFHLEQALGSWDSEPLDLSSAARESGLKSQRELLLWLEGTWLEEWVLTCARDLDCGHRAQGLEGYAPQKFEIDVAVMRGYQLFAFSCGVTSVREKAKLKFLEIYTRARQIGGDEARSAMVCSVEDPESLEQEIAYEWDTGNRVRVFGRQHLADLKSHLGHWFETV